MNLSLIKMTAMGNDNYVQSAVRAGQDGYMKVDGRKLGVRTLTHSRSHVFFFSYIAIIATILWVQRVRERACCDHMLDVPWTILMLLLQLNYTWSKVCDEDNMSTDCSAQEGTYPEGLEQS